MANWIDNLIGFISPEAGYKREAYRNALNAMRSYDAGNYRGSNQNWHAVIESAESEESWNRDTVRARARDLERNSDIMNSIISPFVRNVYGQGYKLKAHTGDDGTNAELEKLWKKWNKKQNCDVTERQSFNEMMRTAVRRKKVDGGIIFLKCYTSGGLVPYKLQMLEVDELDPMQTAPHFDGDRVINGIEYNQFNKPMGYWFRKYDISGYTTLNSEFHEAKDVIFIYSLKRPSQAREFSDMAQTITRVRDINEFVNAVSVKERVLACLSVFIKRALPPANGGMYGRGGNAPQSDERYQGKTLVPGMINYLSPGDEVQSVVPNGQAVEATGFIKQQTRMAGAGQGLSYEATSRDMSESNYSSARQGSIEDDTTYDEEKELFMEAMDEIYEDFIISCVLKGKIILKDFWDDKDKYFNHEWIKRPKKWIDPAKEANADKIALEIGEKTFADLAAERGKDWREQIDELAEIQQYAKSKGVNLTGGLNDTAAGKDRGNA